MYACDVGALSARSLYMVDHCVPACVGEETYSLRREGAEEGELIELFVTEWPQSIDYCSGSSLEQRDGSMGEAARQIEATLCIT